MDDLISVVVGTYNREDALSAVLRSLSRQTDRHFEVTVADVSEEGLSRAARTRPLVWVACLLLGSGLMAATAAPPGHAETNPPRNPPRSSEIQPAPPSPSGTGSQDTGVIRPPAHVDPGITKAAPNPQEFPTPVVPPPGTPGGNPQVVPK